MVSGVVLRVCLGVAVATLLANAHSFCRAAAQLPHAPLAQLGWATFDWLLILGGIWSLSLIGQSLRYRRARRVGPPQVWAWLGTGDPTKLSVVAFGIDPQGSPAWRVDDMVLPPGVSIAISRLTRHAALYIPIDHVVVRVEARGGGVLSATPVGAL